MNKCLSATICALFISAAANAAETTTYTYDALGRLVASSTTGGPATGTVMSTTLDGVDNRTNYSVAPVGSSNCRFFVDDYEGTDEFSIYVNVRRTGLCSGPVVINYVTADGTAQAGVHYYPVNGSLTFQTADTVKTIFIYPPYPSVFGSSRYFYVNIGIASGAATLGDAQTVITIIPSN